MSEKVAALTFWTLSGRGEIRQQKPNEVLRTKTLSCETLIAHASHQDSRNQKNTRPVGNNLLDLVGSVKYSKGPTGTRASLTVILLN
jgi:hypothetical protein